jgi:hypothetical protein
MEYIYIRAKAIFEYYDLFNSLENYITVKYKLNPVNSVKDILNKIKISANVTPEKLKDIKSGIINKSEYRTKWVINQNRIELSLEPELVLSISYDKIINILK